MGKKNLMDAWLDEASQLSPGQDAEFIALNEKYWALLAEPKLQQDVAFHVLDGLVQSNFALGRIEKALEWSKLLDRFDFVADGRVDDGQKDLTIGRVYYALGNRSEALRRWTVADRLSRGRCFDLPFAKGAKALYVDLAKGKGKAAPDRSTKKTGGKRQEADDGDDELQGRITKLSEEGSDRMERGDPDGAIKLFNAALELLPEPKSHADAAGWLWASLGDAYYEKKDYRKAYGYFSKAHTLAEMLDNPLVLLRLGQCSLEMKDDSKAVDFLLRAYMVEGKKIFKDEKKYFDFLASKVDLNKGRQALGRSTGGAARENSTVVTKSEKRPKGRR